MTRIAPPVLLALLFSACSHGSRETTDAAPAQVPSAPLPTTQVAAPSAPALSAPAAPFTSCVDLSGTFTPEPPLVAGKGGSASGTVGVRVMEAGVYQRADLSSPRVGTLRAGAVVATDGAKVSGAGCADGFVHIPGSPPGGPPNRTVDGGFVCLTDVTSDLADPIVAASTRRPDYSTRLPYLYGTCKRGGPVYNRIPTEEDLRTFEPHLDEHLAKWKVDPEFGAAYSPELWHRWKDGTFPDPLKALSEKLTTDPPSWLASGGRVPNLSGQANSAVAKIGDVATKNGLSFVDTFFSNGRRYAVTTDLRVVAADRFRPLRGSEFHGVRLGVDKDPSGELLDFPFAFVKGKGGKKWIEEKNHLVQKEELTWRAAYALTGKTRKFDGKFLWETKEGFWLDEKTSVRIDAAKKWPKWAKDGEKWLDVNISKQTLVAYEGMKGAYATIVSTGEAGLDDPETSKATKRGIFRIHTKYVAATMDSKIVGEEFELRDVPYVQYFEGGYALHAAYWHDVFGMPKSHGCINLAPEDARRLFFFTDPPLPPRWHGVSKARTGTVIFIHP